MSKRNKLQKFAEIYRYPHVFENFNPKDPKLLGEQGKEVQLKGEWANKFFQNEHPITLELACGKGDYTIGLAQRFPDRNFIGVDIKGARIWRGAKTAVEDNLSNVAFLRTRIEQLNYFFSEGEVADIWITFADPFLSKPNRRLTNPKFLNMFYPILQTNGQIHLKTDSTDLYEYTLEVMRHVTNYKITYLNEDIYSGTLYDDALEIKTFYEKQHLKKGKTIKYILLDKV
jgi:tRNA (guanine-N7-)-methyltransferase